MLTMNAPNASAVMKKLAGYEMKKARVNPSQTARRATAADSAMPAYGRVVRFWATAAGVTIRPNTSRAPTAWTDSATVIATRMRKKAVTTRIGTPRDVATSGSRLTNSRGRASATAATLVRIPVTEAINAWVGWIPKIEPNSTLMP